MKNHSLDVSPDCAPRTCCFVTPAGACAIEACQSITRAECKSPRRALRHLAVKGTESTSKRYSVEVNCVATCGEKRGNHASRGEQLRLRKPRTSSSRAHNSASERKRSDPEDLARNLRPVVCEGPAR